MATNNKSTGGEQNNLPIEEAQKEEKEENKTEPKSKKHLFNEKDYVVEREVEVMEKDPETGRKFPKLVVKQYMKKEWDSHLKKCLFRAARRFGVSVDHLRKSYEILNGKKIDGFYITDILDRYGISDGQLMNRADLCKKYDRSSIRPLEIAEDKLATICQDPQPLKAYSAYIKTIQEELEKKQKEDALYGS